MKYWANQFQISLRCPPSSLLMASLIRWIISKVIGPSWLYKGLLIPYWALLFLQPSRRRWGFGFSNSHKGPSFLLSSLGDYPSLILILIDLIWGMWIVFSLFSSRNEKISESMWLVSMRPSSKWKFSITQLPCQLWKGDSRATVWSFLWMKIFRILIIRCSIRCISTSRSRRRRLS